MCGGGGNGADSSPPTEAKIADIRFEKALRDKFISTPGGVIEFTDQVRITLELDLADKQISSIEGIQVFRNLETLDLHKNKLTDVKGLENLTKLEVLYLDYNQLTSVKGLEKLTKLRGLYLAGNYLTDVKGLVKFTQLGKLNLANNKLTSVKGLEKLTQLTYLNLDGNKLTDVKGLEKFTQLGKLDLKDNPDLNSDHIDQLLKALPKCTISQNARLSERGSAKVIEAAIRSAVKLRLWELSTTGSNPHGVDPPRIATGELTKADYEKVTKLWLNGNRLTDVKGLEKLTQLTRLDLHKNKLTDVNGLEKLTQLTRLYLYNNQLTDVKGLEKLTQLKYLELEDNPDLTKAQIAELQKALPNCEIISNPTK